MSEYNLDLTANEINERLNGISVEEFNELKHNLLKIQSFCIAGISNTLTISNADVRTVSFDTWKNKYDPLNLYSINSNGFIYCAEDGVVEINGVVVMGLDALPVNLDSFITVNRSDGTQFTQRHLKATRAASDAPFHLYFEPQYINVNAGQGFTFRYWNGGVSSYTLNGEDSTYKSYIQIKYVK